MNYYNDYTPEIEGEEWRQHPIFTDYEGSSLGRIRAKERVTTSVWGRKNGEKRTVIRKWKPIIVHQHKAFNYLSVQIKHTSYFVHRFICECWYGMATDMQAHHIDEDRYNNKPSNLSWVTPSGNMNANDLSVRARKTRKQNYPKNEWVVKMVNNRKGKNACRAVVQYTMDNEFVGEYSSIKEVQIQTGFDQGYIGHCCRGKYKQAYGYIWKYKETLPN